jgi:hypothetical protein
MAMSTERSAERWYLAGPMGGRPQFNIPAFDEAARILRADGRTIVSPAELDSPEVRAASLVSPDGTWILNKISGETWGDLLARDVKLIADEVDGIIFLPEWHTSRGARLEAFVGLLTGKQFAVYLPEYQTILCVVEDYVRNTIKRNMP